MIIISPRAIGACIFLFLASALVTLSLRNTQHSGSSWLSKPGAAAGRQDQNNIVKLPSVAFATFLASNTNPDKMATDEESAAINDTDDGYYISARVLGYQLLHSQSVGTNNSIPFLVLCTTQLSERKRDRLAKDGATIVLVDELQVEWVTPLKDRWVDVLAKLRLFQLTEYSKILYIDADTLVTKRLDGIFLDESTLTQATLTNPEQIKSDESPLPLTYMLATHADIFGFDRPYPPPTDGTYLNAGFFVLTPSHVLFDYYMSLLKLPGRFDPEWPEQNLLNYAHRREGNMPWKPLWYGWNVGWPTEKDWTGGAASFHAKYFEPADPSNDPFLMGVWREQRAEMEGFFRGRDMMG